MLLLVMGINGKNAAKTQQNITLYLLCPVERVRMSGTIAPNPLRAAQVPRRSRCAASPRMVIVASSNNQVTLLDYGAGNVCSVRNAIKKLGYSIKDVRQLQRTQAQ